jgi:hypothetical protein
MSLGQGSKRSLTLLLLVPLTAVGAIGFQQAGLAPLGGILLIVVAAVLGLLAFSKASSLGDGTAVDLPAFWRYSIAMTLVVSTYSLTQLFGSAGDPRQALLALGLVMAAASWLLLLFAAYRHTSKELGRLRDQALQLAREALAASSSEAAERLWLEAEGYASQAGIRPPTREMLAFLLQPAIEAREETS